MELIEACTELVNAELGALAARCPHCQGELEIRPVNDRIDIGYCVGSNEMKFAVAQSLPFEGLVVMRQENPPSLEIIGADRRWTFQA